MALQDYFREPGLSSALDRYRQVVTNDLDWPVAEKHRLYGLAKRAFEEERGTGRGEEAFGQIFEALKAYWKMFRNAWEGGRWDATTTYQALLACEEDAGRSSQVTLLTIGGSSDQQQAVLRTLERLRGMKAVKSSENYPWMPASKVLHFFNPRAFPIYDDALVWQTVLWRSRPKRGSGRDAAFRADYERFCRARGLRPRETTERFNLNYGLFASEIFTGCDVPVAMRTFENWFTRQTGGVQAGDPVLREVPTYYGAAFEMIAIGAASLELAAGAR